jgi:hypothetical protein
MAPCSVHADGPDPERSRGAESRAQGPRGAGRYVRVRVSADGVASLVRTANRAAEASGTAGARATAPAPCGCRTDRAQPTVIVLDASAALGLLLVTDKGRRVAERIVPPDETLHAPHLIDLEVAQVLRRYVGRREIGEVRAGQALEDFRDVDLNRHPKTCSWAGSGSCVTTCRPTTPCISPWPRRSALPCSPPTPAWATSRTRGHASGSFDVAPCRSLVYAHALPRGSPQLRGLRHGRRLQTSSIWLRHSKPTRRMKTAPLQVTGGATESWSGKRESNPRPSAWESRSPHFSALLQHTA